jgi:hypothetical protein
LFKNLCNKIRIKISTIETRPSHKTEKESMKQKLFRKINMIVKPQSNLNKEGKNSNEQN